jgi:branched-chain amino acid transport system ATP-binding protein
VTDQPLLQVDSLSAIRGGAVVVRDISFTIPRGGAFGLLGANGAGKTTIVDAICGFAKKSAGRVVFAGSDVTRARPETLARRGLVQVSQDRELFASLTVRENLVLGARAARSRLRREDARLAEVVDLFPRLSERIGSRAGSLSGGEQQMLAIGRALMGEPILLLLDEPMSGLAPVIVNEVASGLRGLRDTGLSILLVEQNVDAALRLCDQLVVIKSGDTVFSGATDDLGPEPRRQLGQLYV